MRCNRMGLRYAETLFPLPLLSTVIEAGPSYTPRNDPPAHLNPSSVNTTTPTCDPLLSMALDALNGKKPMPKQSNATGEDVFQSKAIDNKRKIGTLESYDGNVLNGKKQKMGKYPLGTVASSR